jgi:hypothetical protein
MGLEPDYNQSLIETQFDDDGISWELVSWAKGRAWIDGQDPINPETNEPYDAVVQFYNLFPCIDFHADIVLHYVGTIPAKIIETSMGWTGDETLLPDGTTGDWLTYLEGLYVTSGGQYGLTYHIGASALPEQIHYCDRLHYNVNIHLPQDNLFQGLSGTGYLTMKVQQWNDDCDTTLEDKLAEFSLPTTLVTLNVQHPWALPPSYFKSTITGTGYTGPNAAYNVWDDDWVGWCVDEEHTINSGQNYPVILYSSYDAALPAYFADEDWDKVNWIINHKADFEPYTADQMQKAIWYFIDGGYTGSDQKIWDIIDAANANGEDFVPQAGQWIAVCCDAGPNVQATFIEVDP